MPIKGQGPFQGSLFSTPSEEDVVVNFYKPPFDSRVHEQAKQRPKPGRLLSAEKANLRNKGEWEQAAFSFGNVKDGESSEEESPLLEAAGQGPSPSEEHALQEDLSGHLHAQPRGHLQVEVDQFSRAWEKAHVDTLPKTSPFASSHIFIILVLLCLILGMDLALFGVILFAYSQEGLLRLEWVADYWFFYALFGVGLFYGGVRWCENLFD